MFTYYLYLAPIVACVLILLNYLISTSNSYIEKDGPFECGFTSYQQSRSAFSASFILIAILFLPFDLEISSVLPYVISASINGSISLIILIIYLLLLVIAFIYELKSNIITSVNTYNYNEDITRTNIIYNKKYNEL